MSHNLALLQLCFDDSEFVCNNASSSPATYGSTDRRASTTTHGGATMMNGGDSDGSFFDPAMFVISKLDHVAPSTLSADLRTYRDILQESVLRCVHDEVYQGFVDVSGQLVTAGPNIQNLSGPLQTLCTETEEDKDVLETARHTALSHIATACRHELSRRFCSANLEVLLLHHSQGGI